MHNSMGIVVGNSLGFVLVGIYLLHNWQA